MQWCQLNSLPETGKIICNKIIGNKTIFCLLDTPLLIWQVWEHYKKLGLLLWSISLSSNQNKPSYILTYVIQTTFCKSFVRVAFMGTQREEGGGLESVLVLERDTKTHSSMRIRYSADKFLNHIMCCWLFRPTQQNTYPNTFVVVSRITIYFFKFVIKSISRPHVDWR